MSYEVRFRPEAQKDFGQLDGSQKTPPRELARAKEARKDYIRQQKE